VDFLCLGINQTESCILLINRKWKPFNLHSSPSCSLPTCRSEVAKSVVLLWKQTWRIRKSRKEWLCAVPLYNFLKASSEPFAKLELNPEKTPFISHHELGLEEYKKIMDDSEDRYVQFY